MLTYTVYLGGSHIFIHLSNICSLHATVCYIKPSINLILALSISLATFKITNKKTKPKPKSLNTTIHFKMSFLSFPPSLWVSHSHRLRFLLLY